MPSSAIHPKYVKQIHQNSSLADLAYDAIRDAIITGRIKPGERMMQVDLAKELGVSERTVREAFARLVAKGLATHEPFKGVRVVALSIEELKEIYTMRAVLEGHAMELAAQRILPEDLAKMKELLPLTATREDPASIQTAQEMNRQFHWIPIQAAGSRVLARILEELWELMFAYNLLYEDTEEAQLNKSRNDLIQHTDLIQALEARDGERAKKVNTDHINRTLNTLMEWWRKNSSSE